MIWSDKKRNVKDRLKNKYKFTEDIFLYIMYEWNKALPEMCLANPRAITVVSLAALFSSLEQPAGSVGGPAGKGRPYPTDESSHVCPRHVWPHDWTPKKFPFYVRDFHPSMPLMNSPGGHPPPTNGPAAVAAATVAVAPNSCWRTLQHSILTCVYFFVIQLFSFFHSLSHIC